MKIIITIIIILYSSFSRADFENPALEKIPDTRIKINENSSTKYSKRSGYLSVKYDNNNDFSYNACTATYISKEYLLTSAHCVYRKDLGFIKMAKYTPESMGENNTMWESKYIEKIYVMNKYIEIADSQKNENEQVLIGGENTELGPEYDIAILKVNKYTRTLSNKKTGWNSFYYLEQDSRKLIYDHHKWPVIMFSYPSDKPVKTMWKQNDCFISYASKYSYYHNCANAKGASGSAILAEHPIYSPQYGLKRELDESKGSKDKIFVIAVNSAMMDKSGLSVATRITKDRVKKIKSIIAGRTKYTWGNMFTEVNLEFDSLYEDTIVNKCNSTIQVALSFTNIRNEEENIGFFRLKPNEKISNLIKTQSHYYLIWASKLNSRIDESITSEEGYFREIKGVNLNMEKIIMDEGEGYYKNELFCN